MSAVAAAAVAPSNPAFPTDEDFLVAARPLVS
jgi:hypothetical protein